jgi:hypothetical protein
MTLRTYAITETIVTTKTYVVVACDAHDATNVIRAARHEIRGGFSAEIAQARIKAADETSRTQWSGLAIPGLPERE